MVMNEKDELRMLQGQITIYRKRITEARELLDDALGTMDHASHSVVVEEVKRTIMLATHKLATWLDRDSRFLLMDGLE